MIAQYDKLYSQGKYRTSMIMSALSERINLRTNAETKSLLARAASFRGLSLSNFLLEAAQQMAQEVLKGQE